eukprot:TRINITY_DN15792_c0_g1_i4.p1 TRINITY_DN15792_c0_g1~~TRINITY_DN15792_c0_g1_i4.p1  ORF type:complete len:100 (-),score=12.24 TRINITY_DN15792_c0_g1_i4:11-310(-)
MGSFCGGLSGRNCTIFTVVTMQAYSDFLKALSTLSIQTLSLIKLNLKTFKHCVAGCLRRVSFIPPSARFLGIITRLYRSCSNDAWNCIEGCHKENNCCL